MTTQEAYEQIRKFFSQPGAQFAYDADTAQCCYCTEDGRKCAVGCLIPDELYDDTIEGRNARALVDESYAETLNGTAVKALVKFFDGVDPQFLERAQEQHDRLAEDQETYTTADFIEALDIEAVNFGLKLVR